MPSKPINITYAMKKFISFLISFLIIWALVAGGTYMIGMHDSDLTYCIGLGFAGALGGACGPIVAAWIGKLLKR